MVQGLFNSTTVPVLEQVVAFSQARHNVLAGNIANLDVPGYRARDLSVGEFQQALSQAIDERRSAPTFRSPGEPEPLRSPELAEAAKMPEMVLYHDDGTKGLEYQVTEMVKNQMQHNLALTVMVSQFNLLRAAISERT